MTDVCYVWTNSALQCIFRKSTFLFSRLLKLHVLAYARKCSLNVIYDCSVLNSDRRVRPLSIKMILIVIIIIIQSNLKEVIIIIIIM